VGLDTSVVVVYKATALLVTRVLMVFPTCVLLVLTTQLEFHQRVFLVQTELPVLVQVCVHRAVLDTCAVVVCRAVVRLAHFAPTELPQHVFLALSRSVDRCLAVPHVLTASQLLGRQVVVHVVLVTCALVVHNSIVLPVVRVLVGLQATVLLVRILLVVGLLLVAQLVHLELLLLELLHALLVLLDTNVLVVSKLIVLSAARVPTELQQPVLQEHTHQVEEFLSVWLARTVLLLLALVLVLLVALDTNVAVVFRVTVQLVVFVLVALMCSAQLDLILLVALSAVAPHVQTVLLRLVQRAVCHVLLACSVLVECSRIVQRVPLVVVELQFLVILVRTQ